MDFESVRKVQAELAETPFGKKVGKTALTILSMALSAVPVAGGPLSMVSEEVKRHLFDPDYSGLIRNLADAIESIAPQLELIDSLEERISLLESLGQDNYQAAASMAELFDVFGARGLDPLVIQSVGGFTEFRDNVVRNMHLHSVATASGQTVVDHIDATGTALFHTSSGGKQYITNSSFLGGSGGFIVQNSIKNAVVEGNTTVELAPPGENIGVSVTGGPNPTGERRAGFIATPHGVIFGGKID